MTKIRIKETGEIKIVADYVKVSVEDCNSYGNPFEYSLNEIEIIQDGSEEDDNNQLDKEIDWEKFKIKASIAAMQGILSNPEFIESDDYGNKRRLNAKECSDYATWYGNDLIETLKNKINQSL